MPDNTIGSATSLPPALSAFQNTAAAQPLGQAYGQFRGLLADAVGEQMAGEFDSLLNRGAALAEAGPTAPRGFGGPTGQVKALGEDVSRAISDRLTRVRESETEARGQVQEMLTGGDVELHNVIAAAERAKLELQLTMTLRNKLVEAYQEVMRLPL